jgi:hypothetical protein
MVNVRSDDRDHLLAARCADGIVYLDVAGDTYLCAHAPRHSAWGHVDDPLHAPAGRRLPHAPARIGAGSILLFLRALARTAIDFGRRDFAGLLAAIDRLPSGGEASDPPLYAQAVAHFERLCLFVPFSFNCLFRSYFLLFYLTYQRLPATWLFGVSLFPFEAHCWVMAGEFLVGERAERLESLTIIHSVGTIRP